MAGSLGRPVRALLRATGAIRKPNILHKGRIPTIGQCFLYDSRSVKAIKKLGIKDTRESFRSLLTTGDRNEPRLRHLATSSPRECVAFPYGSLLTQRLKYD